MKLITTLSLRHEDALAIHRQDTSYVFFMKTSPPELTVLSDLMRVGSEWKAKKEQSPALVTQPLRVVLLGCLLEAVTTRMQSLQDPTLRAKAQAAKLVNQAGDFHYMMWDDTEKVDQNKINPHESSTRGHRNPAEADPTATSGRTLSCPEEARAGHAGGSGTVRSGDWSSQSGLTRSLPPAGQVLPPGDLAPGRHVPEARQTGTRSVGQCAGEACREALRRLRLQLQQPLLR